jgi:hypothetical protein
MESRHESNVSKQDTNPFLAIRRNLYVASPLYPHNRVSCAQRPMVFLHEVLEARLIVAHMH